MATTPTDAEKAAAAAAAKADKDAADKAAAEKKAAEKKAAPKPNQPDKFADAAEDGLVDGETAFLTAVHGRIIHPLQVPLEFNPGQITKVKVDSWVRIQYEAGKLAKADDEKGARKG